MAMTRPSIDPYRIAPIAAELGLVCGAGAARAGVATSASVKADTNIVQLRISKSSSELGVSLAHSGRPFAAASTRGACREPDLMYAELPLTPSGTP